MFVRSDELFYKIGESRTTIPNRETNVIRFICRNILSKFGILRPFVLDNGTQFVGQKVKDLLGQLKIEFYNSPLTNRKCNGQA